MENFKVYFKVCSKAAEQHQFDGWELNCIAGYNLYKAAGEVWRKHCTVRKWPPLPYFHFHDVAKAFTTKTTEWLSPHDSTLNSCDSHPHIHSLSRTQSVTLRSCAKQPRLFSYSRIKHGDVREDGAKQEKHFGSFSGHFPPGVSQGLPVTSAEHHGARYVVQVRDNYSFLTN